MTSSRGSLFHKEPMTPVIFSSHLIWLGPCFGSFLVSYCTVFQPRHLMLTTVEMHLINCQGLKILYLTSCSNSISWVSWAMCSACAFHLRLCIFSIKFKNKISISKMHQSSRVRDFYRLILSLSSTLECVIILHSCITEIFIFDPCLLS